ncbi:MAG: hypothetical protein WCK21_00010 [Actinomycetota bacterium]
MQTSHDASNNAGPLTEDECVAYAVNKRPLVANDVDAPTLAPAHELAVRSEQTAVSIRTRFADDGLTAELIELLSVFGWMLYEVTWRLVQRNELKDGGPAAGSLRELLKRFAECAESIELKQYAPRAGGAIRAYALALSKMDRTDGYKWAAAQHDAADKWIRQVLSNAGSDKRLQRDAREVQVQLETGKAGTACRQIETFLCAPWRLDNGATVDRRLKEIARNARVAITAAVSALEIFQKIPLDAKADRRTSMASPVWPRQPANMAARAHLLLVPCLASLEALDVPYQAALAVPLWEVSQQIVGVDVEVPLTYGDELEFHRRQVDRLVGTAEAALIEGFGASLGSVPDNEAAETARVRLHYAVQFPGLPLGPPPAAFSYHAHTGGSANGVSLVDELSAWLMDRGQNANAVATTTYRPWIEGLIRVRAWAAPSSEFVSDDDYLDWRCRFKDLDRFWRVTAGTQDEEDERTKHLGELGALLGDVDWPD